MPDKDQIEAELSAAEIVDMVTTVEEEEEEDPDAVVDATPAAVSLTDACKAVSAFLNFATSNPNMFSTKQVGQIQELMDTTFRAQVANLAIKKQMGIRFQLASYAAGGSDDDDDDDVDAAAADGSAGQQATVINSTGEADEARCSDAEQQHHEGIDQSGQHQDDTEDAEGEADKTESDAYEQEASGGDCERTAALLGLIDSRWGGE